MKTYYLFVLLLLISVTASAVGYSGDGTRLSAGLFQSTKGIGLSLGSRFEGNKYRSFSAILDLDGVLSGRSSSGGIKIRYTGNRILKEWNSNPELNTLIFVGSGFTAGYVRDSELHMGLMAGVSGVAGVRFDFISKLSLKLEWELDIAPHIYRSFDTKTFELGIYDNGFKKIYVPQLTISYRF